MLIPRYLIALIKAIALVSILDPGAVAAQSVREIEAWAAARFINTPAAYQWFLEMFPDGQYAMKAFQHLADDITPGNYPPATPYTTAWDWGGEEELSEALY